MSGPASAMIAACSGHIRRRGVFDVKILRGEFDADGYDLVMERGKIVRHMQFNSDDGAKWGLASELAWLLD